MTRKIIKAANDEGSIVELTEVRDSQTVHTSDRDIKFNERPQVFGPDGEQLVKETDDTFRSPEGKLFRLLPTKR